MNKNNSFIVVEKLILVGVFLSPFNTLTLSIAYITISDLFFIFLLPVLMIKMLLSGGKIIPESHVLIKPIVTKWFFGASLIIFGFLVSLLVSQSGRIFDTISTLLQYSFVFIYLPIVLILVRREKYFGIIKAYIYGMVAVILIGISLELFYNSLYLDLIQRGILIGRVRFGSFLGSNGLVKTLAMCIPLVFILFEEKKLRRVELLAIIITFLIGIVKASSIGGTLASILAFFLSFFLIRNQKIKRNIALTTVLVSLIFIVLIIQQTINIDTFLTRVVESFLSGDLDDAGSFSLKISLMKEALSTIANNPITGLGSKGFVEMSLFNQAVHNSYLLIWAEGGIFAFLGLMTILISNISFSFKGMKFKQTKSRSIFALIFIAIFALNLVTGTHIYQRFRIIPWILVMYSLPYGAEDLKYRILDKKDGYDEARNIN